MSTALEFKSPAARQWIERLANKKPHEVNTKYVSPAWTGEFGGSAVTRDQLVENVRNQLQTFDEITWPRTISNPRTDGDKLTVRAEGPYQAVKQDTREPVQMQLANDDTWQKGPNGWLNIYSKALET